MDWARYVGWMKPSWPIGKKNDNGSFVTAPLLGQVPSVPEGNQCQNSLMLQLFSLGASLTLLPYMGKDGLLKDPLFSDNYRWWVNVVFPSWWILVCMGVPCSVWGRWPFEIKIARVSTHLGMLGITLLVVMFSHWMLAVDATWVPGCLLIFATAFFFGFWIRCCFSGDM